MITLVLVLRHSIEKRSILTIISIIAQVGKGARCVTTPSNGCEGDYMTNGPGGGGTQVY